MRALFFAKIPAAWGHPQFTSDVVKPLHIDGFLDQEVRCLPEAEQDAAAYREMPALTRRSGLGMESS